MNGFHIAQNLLGAIGYLMQATEIDDIMIAAEGCLRGTTNKLIYGKDYYAMLHVHTMGHASFTIPWETLARYLINEENDMEYISMLAFNAQILLDAQSENNVDKPSACADATHIKRPSMADVHGHCDR